MSHSFMVCTHLVHLKHGQANITRTISHKKMLKVNTCTIGKTQIKTLQWNICSLFYWVKKSTSLKCK